MKSTQPEKRPASARRLSMALFLLPLLLAALLLPQCESKTEPAETQPTFAIYIGVDAPDERFSVPVQDRRGNRFYRTAEPLLTAAHIASLERRRQGGGEEILLHLNDAGRDIVQPKADAHAGRRQLVILNGRVISAGTLVGKLGHGVSLSDEVLGFPRPANRQMDDLEAELRQAIFGADEQG